MKTAEEWIDQWSQTVFRGPGDIRLVQKDAMAHCAELIGRLPIDKDRCAKLQLTEQAWGEALEAAQDSILKAIEPFGEL